MRAVYSDLDGNAASVKAYPIGDSLINNTRIVYTDSKSPSHDEARILRTFLRQNGTLNAVEVIIDSRDNGSLLRSNYRQQLWNMINEINTKITVEDSSGHQLTYYDMCEPYCQKNEPVTAFLDVYNRNFSRVNATYPIMDILGKRIFIADNIYGVRLDNDTNNIVAFTTVSLQYLMVYPETKPLLEWEAKVVSLVYDSCKYDRLRSSIGSDRLIDAEMRKMGSSMAPFISVTLFLLMMFLMLCSLRYKRRESKLLEAIIGGVVPLLAEFTTIGLLSATGIAFQSIVVSTLFMILAIGIDDVFIMLAAWHSTDKSMDTPKRTAKMVQVSGSSMTITSLTNMISFGTGVFSSTLALQTFAIYSAVSSAICYFYQLMIFPALLTLTAHGEYRSGNDSRSDCLPEELTYIKYAGEFHDRAWKYLARLVVKPWMKHLTVLALISYWTATYYGISAARTELALQTVLPHGRSAQFKRRHDEILKEMQILVVVVTTPGDLRDPRRLANVSRMIEDYELTAYSYGPESTLCFLKPYMDFVEFREIQDEEEALSLQCCIGSFCASSGNLRTTTGTIWRVDYLTTKAVLIGDLVHFYQEMIPLVQEWRDISKKYSELGVYPYSPRSDYVDQSAKLGAVIWQTLFSAIICMGIAFIFFIPDIVSIAAAMFSLLSVNLGTPREKLEHAFLNIGWPAMQGILSTCLGGFSILIKPSYLGTVFAKTIFLVSVIGLIHGFIVLPVFLSMLTSLLKYGKSAIAPCKCDQPDKSISASATPPTGISDKATTDYVVMSN
ncbi:SSD domain-containing protein [Trichostrongylus colubriformis]|uniref:SSD domain-containing protein n=1 Tax=Trichostrongylus colubriformis TaxID=6319 RepID=A0AAN8GF53_TRICO